MEIESAENIKKKIKKKYNKNPGEWQFLACRDQNNYFNSVILHGKDMWVIKEAAINPYKSLGLGVKTKIDRNFKPLLKNPYSFGLRPVHDLDIEMLSENISTGTEVVKKILRTKPVPYNKISRNAPLLIQGPVITPQRPIALSKAQEELDRKLQKNLRDLIYRKRPDLMLPYI